METHHLDYASLSEKEMVAAEQAASLEECQAHLDRAVRYASLACLAHQRSPDFNVAEIRPGVRR
jgi:hypothetical protein